MIWQKIHGFSNYMVSEFGDIKSLDHFVPPYTDKIGRFVPSRLMSGRVLKMRRHEFGYLMCSIVSDNGIVVGMTAHRAVALGFKGAPSDKKQVARHMNGDASYNHHSNIEWGTQADNIADAMRHGTIQKGEGRYNAKLTEEDVIELRELVLAGDKFALIASYFGISESICYRIAVGEKWASVGGPLYSLKRQNRLSVRDKVVIKSRLNLGEKMKPLAKEFKVSVTQIRNIRDERHEDC